MNTGINGVVFGKNLNVSLEWCGELMIDGRLIDECCTEEGSILTDDDFENVFEAIRRNHELKPYAMCCICSFCLSLVIDTMTHPKFNSGWDDYYLDEVGRRMNGIYGKPQGFNRSHFMAEICGFSRMEATRRFWVKQGKENPVADIFFALKSSQTDPLSDLIKKEEILIFLEEFSKLTPHEKFIFCEHSIEGRTQQEIAEDSGYSSKASINNILKQARDILRKKIGERYKISSTGK